jgi:hypothetical protein
MNSERLLYIRAIKQNQPGVHRIGLIMLTPVDAVTYITASLCNPSDKFCKAAAVGKCRQRRVAAVQAAHYMLDGGTPYVTVDKGIFIRPLGMDIVSNLKNLGIYNALHKNYKDMVDLEYLNTILVHEITHV